jgi:arylsulfatase A-like enzyme
MFEHTAFSTRVPQSMYSSSMDSDRRTYSAMVTALDDVIGNLTSTLQSTGMYDNTIIVFHGDNGADDDYGGSNSPLRGDKGTVYEGGTRTPAFVYSPLLNSDLVGSVASTFSKVLNII